MKQKVLFIALAAFLSLPLAKAGTGSLNVTSPTFPANVEAGGSLSLDLTYTSDVDAKFNWAIFLTQANSNEADWSTWKSGGDIDITAGTDVAASYSIPIKEEFNTANLPEGVNYLLALKLYDGGGDFAYSNTGNILLISPSATVTNSIGFAVAAPTEVKQGDTVTVKIAYTIADNDTCQVKVSLSRYGAGYVWLSDGDLVARYLGEKPATGSTPVELEVKLAIPADAPVSSILENGEFYTFDIGLYTKTWGYLTSSKSDVTLVAKSVETDIQHLSVSRLEAYPIPAHDVLQVKGLQQGNTVAIYNLAGTLVKSTQATAAATAISISDLPKGIYVLQSNGVNTKFIKE